MDKSVQIDRSWRPAQRMEPSTTYRYRRPPHELVDRITPNTDLFVLAHFGVPRIELRDWRLQIVGLVRRPTTLALDDLRSFPKYEIESFVKCAGFPHKHTINTHNVSNVTWAGADLRDVLDAVGLSPQASFIWSYGSDHGTYVDWSADCYLKDVPMERVQQGGVLLAYEVNGETLAPEHGFPVRLFVPGYYGAASVKWLCQLEASDHRAPGVFNLELYNDPVAPEHPDGPALKKPVWEAPPESLIVYPKPHTSVDHGVIHVWGWAWGQRRIDHVEVSCDGGRSWGAADVGARSQYSWQKFEFTGSNDTCGKASIIVRATDIDGNSQPLAEARNSCHHISVLLT